eukprot:TRINITY_DN3054_c0_g1_i1.p1 TRINITY_DN3054_c0_g1~~TRINITY_DN3054_c0_g1_i1.p1  ORF type:complete len:1150 (-),score=305.31 TRINITY_DN3054_c0_g1_i1:5133-8477(-)
MSENVKKTNSNSNSTTGQFLPNLEASSLSNSIVSNATLMNNSKKRNVKDDFSTNENEKMHFERIFEILKQLKFENDEFVKFEDLFIATNKTFTGTSKNFWREIFQVITKGKSGNKTNKLTKEALLEYFENNPQKTKNLRFTPKNILSSTTVFTMKQFNEAFKKFNTFSVEKVNLPLFIEEFQNILELEPVVMEYLFNKINVDCNDTISKTEFANFFLNLEKTQSIAQDDILYQLKFESKFQQIHNHMIVAIEQDPNLADRIITADTSGLIVWWSLSSQTCIKGIHLASDNYNSIMSSEQLIVHSKNRFSRNDLANNINCVTVIGSYLVFGLLGRYLAVFNTSNDTLTKIGPFKNIPTTLASGDIDYEHHLVMGDDAGYVHIIDNLEQDDSKHLKNSKVRSSRSLKVHEGSITCMCKAPGMNGVVATGGSDGNMYLVNCSTMTIRSSFMNIVPAGILNIAVESVQKYFVVAGVDRSVRLIDFHRGEIISHLGGHEGSVPIALTASNRSIFLTVSSSKIVRLFDSMSTKQCQSFLVRQKFIPSDRITSGFMNESICVLGGSYLLKYSIEKQIKDTGGHIRPITHVCFHEEFSCVISLDASGRICIWDLFTGYLSLMFSLNIESIVTYMGLIHNGRHLILSESNGRVFTVNYHNGAIIDDYHDKTEEITKVIGKITEDGSRLVIAVGWDKKVSVWINSKTTNLVSYKELPDLDAFDGHNADIEDVAELFINSSSSMYLTAAADGMIYCWNILTGMRTRLRFIHPTFELKTQNEIQNIGFLAIKYLKSTNFVLALAQDGVLYVYDPKPVGNNLIGHSPAKNELPFYKIVVFGKQEDVGFCDWTLTHDNKTLIVSDTNGILRPFNIEGLSQKEPIIERLSPFRVSKRSIASICSLPLEKPSFLITLENNLLVVTGTGDLLAKLGQIPYNIENFDHFVKSFPKIDSDTLNMQLPELNTDYVVSNRSKKFTSVIDDFNLNIDLSKLKNNTPSISFADSKSLQNIRGAFTERVQIHKANKEEPEQEPDYYKSNVRRMSISLIDELKNSPIRKVKGKTKRSMSSELTKMLEVEPMHMRVPLELQTSREERYWNEDDDVDERIPLQTLAPVYRPALPKLFNEKN